jgi:anti-sigma B factor antagonist
VANSVPLPRTTEPSPGIAIGSTVVLTVRGEVDTLTAGVLEQAARNALRCTPRRLVLDLTEVVFMSASSVASLLRVRRAAHGRGAEIEIVHASPAVTRVLAHVDRGLGRHLAFGQS